jgi:hypothetical protein
MKSRGGVKDGGTDVGRSGVRELMQHGRVRRG